MSGFLLPVVTGDWEDCLNLGGCLRPQEEAMIMPLHLFQPRSPASKKQKTKHKQKKTPALPVGAKQ